MILRKSFLYSAIFLNIILFHPPISIFSQVTIGSDLKPAKGAILQLKENNSLINNSTKGLGIPRVELTSQTDLFPMFEGDNDYINDIGGKKDIQDEMHIGLVVYNVASGICFPLNTGIHVWNGSVWLPLMDNGGDTEKGMFAPNCYMIESDGTAASATTITIPVEKAYSVWEYYSSPDVNRLPAVDLTGSLSANIYWQEVGITWPGGLTAINGTDGIDNPIGNPTVNGTGRNATISVPVTGKYGNAVVSLSIGGVVRWSWHIWVTPPMGTTNSYNGLEWMDRMLGATSVAEPSETFVDLNVYGLYYQQGRKDPFPRNNSNFGLATEPTLSSSGVVTSISTQPTGLDPKQNLSDAITSPLLFIWALDATQDWYSRADADPKDQWDNRWTSDECNIPVKTPFDPCPDGWHVPALVNDASPWTGLTVSSWETLDLGYMGVKWTNPDAGYYPGAGTRGVNAPAGTIEYNAGHFYVWSASPHPDPSKKRNSLAMIGVANDQQNSYTLEVHADAGRANGFSVKCVKFRK